MITTRLKIRDLLRERRWSTKILSEKTGLSESYLTHIKNGTRRWNEDALKKFAEAFEVTPIDILQTVYDHGDKLKEAVNASPELLQSIRDANLHLRLAPVFDTLPANVTDRHEKLAPDIMPVVSFLSDKEYKGVFGLFIKDNSLAPLYLKGDYLIIAPGLHIATGDIIAVEHNHRQKTRAIMRVTVSDNMVDLESIANPKLSPITLIRGKDDFKIIGKVLYRYQKQN